MPYTIGTSIACKVFSRGSPRTRGREGKRKLDGETRIASPRINKPCSALQFVRVLAGPSNFQTWNHLRTWWRWGYFVAPRKIVCILLNANHEKKQYFSLHFVRNLPFIHCISRKFYIITFRSVIFLFDLFFWYVSLTIDCGEMDASLSVSLVFICKFKNDILTAQIWSNFAVCTIEYKTFMRHRNCISINFCLLYDSKS